MHTGEYAQRMHAENAHSECEKRMRTKLLGSAAEIIPLQRHLVDPAERFPVQISHLSVLGVLGGARWCPAKPKFRFAGVGSPTEQ